MMGKRLLSERVTEELLRRLRHGTRQSAGYVLSERGLAKDFGVSRGAVRSALDELEKRGMVIRERGRGTRLLTERINQIGTVALIFGSSQSWVRSRPGLEGLFARLEGVSMALGAKRIPAILCPAAGYASAMFETDSSCTPEIFAAHLAEHASAAIMVEWHHYCVEVARELEKKAFPYVAAYLEEDADVRCVVTDVREVGRRAAEFMVKCGYESALCLIGSRRRYLFNQLAQGFENEWRERKLEIMECEGLTESARTALTSVLNEGRRPEAVFAYGDERTQGALEALRECQVAVPAEVGVLCYGRTSPLTREANVTGFAEPYEHVGRTALEILKGLCGGRSVDRKTVVSAPFVLGRTMLF